MKRSDYYLYTIVLLLGVLLFSCDQEGIFSGNDGDDSSLPAGDLFVVNFLVNENSFNSPLTPRRAYAGEAEEVSILISPLLGELERAVYMHVIIKEEVAPVKLRATKLTMGTKVRVIAYEGPGYTTKVDHADFIVAEGGVLMPDGTYVLALQAGTYRFVAYSYNNADAMPAYADITAAIDAVDLLWGEAIETVGPGNNAVYLLLEHLFSQVKLHAVLHHAVGDIIYDLDASVSHTIPTLEVMIPDLISTGSSALIPFAWPDGAGFASNWYSKNHQVYTDGSPPVVTVGSVDIDGTTYTGGPWTINYATPLVPGHEYILSVYFTADGILCGDLESPDFGTWGNY